MILRLYWTPISIKKPRTGEKLEYIEVRYKLKTLSPFSKSVTIPINQVKTEEGVSSIDIKLPNSKQCYFVIRGVTNQGKKGRFEEHWKKAVISKRVSGLAKVITWEVTQDGKTIDSGKQVEPGKSIVFKVIHPKLKIKGVVLNKGVPIIFSTPISLTEITDSESGGEIIPKWIKPEGKNQRVELVLNAMDLAGNFVADSKFTFIVPGSPSGGGGIPPDSDPDVMVGKRKTAFEAFENARRAVNEIERKIKEKWDQLRTRMTSDMIDKKTNINFFLEIEQLLLQIRKGDNPWIWNENFDKIKNIIVDLNEVCIKPIHNLIVEIGKYIGTVNEEDLKEIEAYKQVLKTIGPRQIALVENHYPQTHQYLEVAPKEIEELRQSYMTLKDHEEPFIHSVADFEEAMEQVIKDFHEVKNKAHATEVSDRMLKDIDLVRDHVKKFMEGYDQIHQLFTETAAVRARVGSRLEAFVKFVKELPVAVQGEVPQRDNVKRPEFNQKPAQVPQGDNVIRHDFNNKKPDTKYPDQYPENEVRKAA